MKSKVASNVSSRSILEPHTFHAAPALCKNVDVAPVMAAPGLALTPIKSKPNLINQ
jgi:hypothetical protein